MPAAFAMSNDRRQIRLSIGSQFENIELVHAVIGDALAELGVDEESSHWIDLAVREGLANAIQHGNRMDPEKLVEVEVTLQPEDEIVVRISDEGEGFDPEHLPDPLEPQNILRPTGRGLLYIQKLMDSVEYSGRSGGGTELVMCKRLPTGEPVEKGEKER